MPLRRNSSVFSSTIPRIAHSGLPARTTDFSYAQFITESYVFDGFSHERRIVFCGKKWGARRRRRTRRRGRMTEGVPDEASRRREVAKVVRAAGAHPTDAGGKSTIAGCLNGRTSSAKSYRTGRIGHGCRASRPCLPEVPAGPRHRTMPSSHRYLAYCRSLE